MSLVLKGFQPNKCVSIVLGSKVSLLYFFNDAYIEDARLLFEQASTRGLQDALYLVYVSSSFPHYDPFFSVARSRIVWTGPDRYRSSICSVFAVTASPLFLVWKLGDVIYDGVSASKALKLFSQTDPTGFEESPLISNESADAVAKQYVWRLTEQLAQCIDKKKEPLSTSKALTTRITKQSSPRKSREIVPVLEERRRGSPTKS
jgi:hypothetical protein